MDATLIERLARQAGFRVQPVAVVNIETGAQHQSFEAEIMSVEPRETLQRFAALVAEECASIADATMVFPDPVGVADAIRAKFKQPARKK